MIKKLNSSTFKKYFFNSSWMLAEQFLRIVSGVFVGIYVARYLGPDSYGILSYLIAVATFLIAISRLGMDAIVVREVVKQEERYEVLTGTAFWLMFVAGVVCTALAVVYFYFSDESDCVKLYACIMSMGCIFTSVYVFDYYFQAKVKAKYSAIIKSIALLVMSLVKLWLIVIQAKLFWFVCAFLADFIILSLFFAIMALRLGILNCLSKFSWHDAKDMLMSAWPLVLGSVAIQIYMRIDQVMIRDILGLREVGIYSAAVRIYEAWVVFLVVITISLLPAIITLKNRNEQLYHNRLSQLLAVVIWSSVLVAVVATFWGEELMVLTFGEDYRESAGVLSIIMWTGVFAGMGTVSARYLNVEKMERKFAVRTVAAAVVNVVLNYLLIPIYGIKGAAISTFMCTFFANYVMDWFDPELKLLLKLKHRAIFRPIG
ncbi:flippase [Pseudomonas sp. NPDC089743]|uniref:flippase n=1 Tax=Pseudomonas sp. NPDC089743 TaxID=3364471 RepID=UPI00380488C4